jgi:hypothetical protein
MQFELYASHHQVLIEDIGAMTLFEAQAAFARPGLHFHAYCWGAMDEALLDTFFQLRAATAYLPA